MINVYVERIRRPEPRGAGFEQLESQYRGVLQSGREIRIEAGKRAEFPVAAGERAVLYVMEGAVRIEGDDTAAGAGDIVWFKPPGARDADARLGLEADLPFRGVLALGESH
jgi:hypothetical protein